VSEDPAEEVVSKGMKLALVAAAIGSQKIAEQIKWRAIAHQAASEAEATRARLAYEAARENARGWLEKFTPDEHMSVDLVADAYTSARAWADVEPDTFAQHMDRIADGIRTRYGVDPEQVATEATLGGTRGTGKGRAAATADALAAGAVLSEAAAEDSRRDTPPAEGGNGEDERQRFDGGARITARYSEAGIDEAVGRPRVQAARAQQEPASAATRGRSVPGRGRRRRNSAVRRSELGR